MICIELTDNFMSTVPSVVMYTHKEEYKTVRALFMHVLPSLPHTGYADDINDVISSKATDLLVQLRGQKFRPAKHKPKEVDQTITIIILKTYNYELSKDKAKDMFKFSYGIRIK